MFLAEGEACHQVDAIAGVEGVDAGQLGRVERHRPHPVGGRPGEAFWGAGGEERRFLEAHPGPFVALDDTAEDFVQVEERAAEPDGSGLADFASVAGDEDDLVVDVLDSRDAVFDVGPFAIDADDRHPDRGGWRDPLVRDAAARGEEQVFPFDAGVGGDRVGR